MTWLFGIVVLCWLGQLEAGPVVGIDIGSTWSKVAMIQGQNLDLVLDETGARRRNTWVGVRGEERVFGRDAERMVLFFLFPPTNSILVFRVVLTFLSFSLNS
jgi:molecular chaperone DnaK (HSP70)